MQQNETGLLLARVKDGIRLCQKRPQYIGFLNENEAALAQGYLKYQNVSYSFYGGHAEGERKILGLFPDFLQDTEYNLAHSFPLSALTFTYRPEDSLGHRDFLGAFMSMGVERSIVGDILIESGRAVVFVREEMQSFFLENVKKIGRTGVTLASGYSLPLPAMHSFQDLSGVIASPRMDCIVAFLCKLSRERASLLVQSGKVMKNHIEQQSVSATVKAGDIISIKSQGKFYIEQLGPLTKKGRLAVLCRKYI